MDARDIFDYINIQFNVTASTSFPHGWQASHSNLISIKTAKPLEQERAEITVDTSKEWELKQKS